MRRNIFTAAALVCAVMAIGAGPALADGRAAAAEPTVSVSADAEPTVSVPADAEPTSPAPADARPAAVPKGAPDTGALPAANQSGISGAVTSAALVGAVLVAGAGVVVMRRRSKTEG